MDVNHQRAIRRSWIYGDVAQWEGKNCPPFRAPLGTKKSLSEPATGRGWLSRRRPRRAHEREAARARRLLVPRLPSTSLRASASGPIAVASISTAPPSSASWNISVCSILPPHLLFLSRVLSCEIDNFFPVLC
jgi:hypothetical protein